MVHYEMAEFMGRVHSRSSCVVLIVCQNNNWSASYDSRKRIDMGCIYRWTRHDDPLPFQEPRHVLDGPEAQAPNLANSCRYELRFVAIVVACAGHIRDSDRGQ
jgi:hypothetical protein